MKHDKMQGLDVHFLISNMTRHAWNYHALPFINQAQDMLTNRHILYRSSMYTFNIFQSTHKFSTHNFEVKIFSKASFTESSLCAASEPTIKDSCTPVSCLAVGFQHHDLRLGQQEPMRVLLQKKLRSRVAPSAILVSLEHNLPAGWATSLQLSMEKTSRF